jgi:isopropylmalate/homocitrate/citramalate synthase
MGNITPWHVPGKWYAVPGYWEPEMQAQLAGKPAEVRLLDCTLAEGPDAVGCHLSWKSCVDLAMMLDDAGVEAITSPGGHSPREESDWIKTVKRNGLKARIVNKLTAIRQPLKPGWKDAMNRQWDIGGDIFIMFSTVEWAHTVTDFIQDITKAQEVDVIQEAIRYAKSRGIYVAYSHCDTMRHRLPTILTFYKAAAEAGADSFYVWDSRGNSNPFISYFFVKKLKEAVGSRPIAIQFHNDIGLAAGNSFAAAMGGASLLDCAVLGIGDRGGCVPMEEIACSLEMYGVRTGMKLEKLSGLAKAVESAFSVSTQLWKPIVGRGAFMENGWGHRDSGDPDETSAGLTPAVVGAGPFKNMMGGRVFSERDSSFWGDMLDMWGYKYTRKDLDEIKERTMHAIIARRGAIDLDEFRAICEGVVSNAGK